MKILIIEDDPSIRELLTEFLQGEGYYVKSLNDVPAQGEDFSIVEFDRVILDLTLPSGRAWEWLSEAKQELPAWNMVITTAATGADLAIKIKDSGCRFLPKPFTVETLFKAIR